MGSAQHAMSVHLPSVWCYTRVGFPKSEGT